jgi:hypothetical protein
MTVGTNPIGSSLVDASTLLLGYNRPLSKVQNEAPPLPLANPLPAKYVGLGEVTNSKNGRLPDAGLKFANERFYSEVYPVPAPICDMRDTNGVLGDPSRLTGRGPMMITK